MNNDEIRLIRELLRSKSFSDLLQKISEDQTQQCVEGVRAAVQDGNLSGAQLAEGRALAWESLMGTLQTYADTAI